MKIIETLKAKFTNVKDLVQMRPVLQSTRPHVVIYYFQLPMTEKTHTHTHIFRDLACNESSKSLTHSGYRQLAEKYQSSVHKGLKRHYFMDYTSLNLSSNHYLCINIINPPNNPILSQYHHQGQAKGRSWLGDCGLYCSD